VFWVFVEAIVYFAVGAIIGFSFGSPQLGLGFVVVCAALVIFAVVQSFRLPRYARPQVASIANDPTAAYDVKNTFDAL
jgi:ABC-type amino acid transport system permease subunit